MPEAVRPARVPRPDLVFLGVQILFAPGFSGAVFDELEGRSINPVTGAQSGCQDQSRYEGLPAAELEVLCQYVGSVRPQAGPKELPHFRLGKVREVFCDLRLGVSPGEVRVRLREAQFRQLVHYLGARERLGEKYDVRPVSLNVLDQPPPERQWLRVGIVHAENAHALLNPEKHDALQFVPELLPVVRFEIKGINVLVFLGRVFRVLDCPVRPVAKPFGMLLDVGMVRGALVGKVEGDLEPIFFGLPHELPEVSQSAELRMDRFVPAFFRADGPGAAGIAGPGHNGIVLPLAKGPSYRVNRRKVEHIKAHRGDIGKPSLAILEGAMPACFRSTGTREHLVPGAETGPFTIYPDRQHPLVPGSKVFRRIALHHASQVLREGESDPPRDIAALTQIAAPFFQTLRAGARHSFEVFLDHAGSYEQVELNVLARGRLLLEIAPPGFETIHPRFQTVLIYP